MPTATGASFGVAVLVVASAAGLGNPAFGVRGLLTKVTHADLLAHLALDLG